MNARVHVYHKRILKVLLKDGRFLHICTNKNLTICTKLARFSSSSERNLKYCIFSYYSKIPLAGHQNQKTFVLTTSKTGGRDNWISLSKVYINVLTVYVFLYHSSDYLPFLAAASRSTRDISGPSPKQECKERIPVVERKNFCHEQKYGRVRLGQMIVRRHVLWQVRVRFSAQHPR
jgi:hypothetical protein